MWQDASLQFFEEDNLPQAKRERYCMCKLKVEIQEELSD